jgi:hypothetical protein
MEDHGKVRSMNRIIANVSWARLNKDLISSAFSKCLVTSVGFIKVPMLCSLILKLLLGESNFYKSVLKLLHFYIETE